MNVRFRPIEHWPGEPTAERRPSPFFTSTRRRSTYSDHTFTDRNRGASQSKTLQLVQRELEHLGATEVLIEVALREDQIRLDGWPKGNASPSHPGVILSFESRHGWLSYPCDTFTKWTDNLYAIGLALEALRKIDRYGVSGSGQQYTGWKKIGAISTPTAERVLLEESGLAGTWTVEHVRLNAREAYLLARKRAHPDAGGSDDRFHAVQQAAAALGVR